MASWKSTTLRLFLAVLLFCATTTSQAHVLNIGDPPQSPFAAVVDVGEVFDPVVDDEGELVAVPLPPLILVAEGAPGGDAPGDNATDSPDSPNDGIGDSTGTDIGGGPNGGGPSMSGDNADNGDGSGNGDSSNSDGDGSND